MRALGCREQPPVVVTERSAQIKDDEDQVRDSPRRRGSAHALAFHEVRHLTIAGCDSSPAEVNTQVAALKHGRVARSGHMTQGNADAGEQLFRPKWLGQVVVGAEVERLHLHRLLSPR